MDAMQYSVKGNNDELLNPRSMSMLKMPLDASSVQNFISGSETCIHCHCVPTIKQAGLDHITDMQLQVKR